MRRYCSILASLTLVLAADLSGQETNRLWQIDPKVAPNLIIPLRPKVTQPPSLSGPFYPVNPPRSPDGQRLEMRSTNFLWMYPVNPPRLVKTPPLVLVAPPTNHVSTPK